MTDAILSSTREKMDNSLESLHGELSKLRTGRASTTILDGVRVDYYGTPTPINQVATLATPEPRLITVQPWESNLIPEIEKAILEANLGVTPSNDGKIVRLPIPKLTEERRKDIVKQVKQFGEDSRVSIRHARRDANEEIKKLKSSSEISEDDMKRAQDQIQKVTDEFIAKVDQVISKKEEDIMTV